MAEHLKLNNNQVLKSEKNVKSETNCKCQKKSPTPQARNTRTTKSLQNENLIPEKAGFKPTEPKKRERQSLRLIDANVKLQKKDGISPKTKSVAPARKGVTPQAKTEKKERRSCPKIVVYKDSPTKPKVQKMEGKSRISKSADAVTQQGRRSLQQTKTTSKAINKSNSSSDVAKLKLVKKTEGQTSVSSPMQKKRPSKCDEMLEKLETMFPNVDPDFMRSKLVKFKGSLTETIEYLIFKEKTNELPTRMQYAWRCEAEKLQTTFMEDFSVENFLKIIPDPWEYFLKKNRENSVNYLGHSLYHLKNKYKKHYLQTIRVALNKNGNSLYLANKELKKKNRSLKMRATNRSKSECEADKPTTFNMQFMEEVAFIENESKIKAYLKKTEAERYKKFTEAKEAGTLLECQSCNDFNLLQDDAVNCPANHVFCKDCVVKHIDMKMEKSNIEFKCLVKCEERFSIESLQEILSPFVLTKVIRRHQVEEIKSAGIDNLVWCPFCYFVAILPPEISVFKCQNPSCMIQSCRKCKQLNHVPLKCQELEKLDEKTRQVEVQIKEEEDKEEEEEEEEVKEAEKEKEKESEEYESVKCSQCEGELVKIKDSKKMLCPCGTTICCICGQEFPECEHFSKPHNLSLSSDDGEIAENRKDTAEGNLEKSSDSPSFTNFGEFFSSESESF